MLRLLLCLLLPLSLQAQPRTDAPCEITLPPCDCAGEISATIDALKKNKAYQRRDPEEFANHLKHVNTELAADPHGRVNCSFYLGYLLYGIRDGHAYARVPSPKYRCTKYVVQLTESINKPKSLLAFEYVGIPVDVPLSHDQDWIEQVLMHID